MRTKKLLPMLLTLAMLLTSCVSAGTRDDAGNTVTVMGKRTDLEKTYMTRIFDLYRESGRGLDIISVEDEKFEAEAARMLQSGKGPDVLMHFNNAELSTLDVKNNFLYLDDQPWVQLLTDSADAYCRDSEGNLLGLPFWESSVSGCYYNKTLLDDLGLRPAATQKEFDTLCQTLTEIGMTPICWPADGCSWMFQFALDPVFADDPELLRQINANEIEFSHIPAVRSMADWLLRAADSGWFGAGYMDTGWDDISPALAQGNAVMTFIWDTWFYTDFTPGKYTVDDFALMPVFMGTVDGGTYEGGNLNMMMVNKNAPNPEGTLDFLSFCAEPENINAAFEGISTVSCFECQTGNIQSQMVTNAAASIAACERVSTASTRLAGYSAGDVLSVFNELLQKKIDIDTCLKRLDETRLLDAEKQGKQ